MQTISNCIVSILWAISKIWKTKVQTHPLGLAPPSLPMPSLWRGIHSGVCHLYIPSSHMDNIGLMYRTSIAA